MAKKTTYQTYTTETPISDYRNDFFHRAAICGAIAKRYVPSRFHTGLLISSAEHRGKTLNGCRLQSSALPRMTSKGSRERCCGYHAFRTEVSISPLQGLPA